MKDNLADVRGRSSSSKFLVYGHYGGRNTGDEAMALALVDGIQRGGGGVQVLLVGKEETQPEFLQKTGCRYLHFSCRKLCMAIVKSDILILGGGTHFHDDYTGTRYIRHLLYMSRIVCFTAFARALGKPSYWIGVGIGPLRTHLGSFVTKAGLLLQSGCSVRDQKSVETVEGLDSKAPVVKAFDLAALLVPHTPSTPPKLVLGVSLTWSAESERGDVPLENFVANALHEELGTDNHWTIRIFVIRGGDREDDTAISSNFRIRLQELLPNQEIEVIPYSEDPEVTLNQIAACSHFIATRFHSAVFAYIGRCRMMIIEYHRKLRDFADEVGLSRNFVVTIEEVMDVAVLRHKIQNLLSEARSQQLLPIEEARILANKNFSFFKASD